nr:hypothetical protein [Tanacetum cinerariifolium]
MALKVDYTLFLSCLPMICDFGLAKWLPEHWTHHTVSRFKGTFGIVYEYYTVRMAGGKSILATPGKKLIIFYVNGMLADIVFPRPKDVEADKYSHRKEDHIWTISCLFVSINSMFAFGLQG